VLLQGGSQDKTACALPVFSKYSTITPEVPQTPRIEIVGEVDVKAELPSPQVLILVPNTPKALPSVEVMRMM